MSEVQNNQSVKNFVTNYKNEYDIANEAATQIRSVAHLQECLLNYVVDYGANKNRDSLASYFLTNLLNDIADGLDEYYDSKSKQNKEIPPLNNTNKIKASN
ncbi:MAG: hypothetical protein ACK5LP_08910 [Campylobacteraceae bacterium]